MKTKTKFYGWLEDDGHLTYIFGTDFQVAMCFMSNVETIKTEKFQKLHKGKLVKLEINILNAD